MFLAACGSLLVFRAQTSYAQNINIDDTPALVPTQTLQKEYKASTEKAQETAKDFCQALYPGDSESAKLNRSECRGTYVKGVVDACKNSLSSKRSYESCIESKRAATEKKLRDEKGEENNKNENPDCDASLSSPLSWIICPIVDLGTGFTDWVFSTFVRGLLEDVPITTETSDGGYKAWQQFRLIANIILIGSLLIVVYSQTRGGGGR